MKNKLKIITILAIGIFLLPACQKDPDLRWPDFQVGVIPVITKDLTKDIAIDPAQFSSFTAIVNVDLYDYGDMPKSMNLMVSMNDDPDNKAVAKEIDLASLPTTCDITIAKLVDLLPKLNNTSEIKSGDKFRFYADIILMDGTVINGNDTLYSAFGTEIANLPGSNTDVVYDVLCPFILSQYVGVYTMDDGYPSDVCDITVTLDPDNPNGLIINNFYGPPNYVGPTYPVKISVSPKYPFVMSVPSPQKFADWLWSTGYKDATITAFSATIDACSPDLPSIKATVEVSAGSFGAIPITLTRKTK